tara:strand:- start:1299 stop:1601 length:303 start_codon:yes stop_codon:yes gene_type:complete
MAISGACIVAFPAKTLLELQSARYIVNIFLDRRIKKLTRGFEVAIGDDAVNNIGMPTNVLRDELFEVRFDVEKALAVYSFELGWGIVELFIGGTDFFGVH